MKPINQIYINRFIVAFLCFGVFCPMAVAQSRYIDQSGHASFFSEAPLENIAANTEEAVSIIDLETGQIVASIAMRSFEFKKSLMQEHFNENYIESHKFPKATFQGKIISDDGVDLSKKGTYPVAVSGEMTIHGVTQPVEIEGELQNDGEKLIARAKFPLRVADFDIEIPSVVMFNIAEVVEVTVAFTYEPLNP